MRRCFSFLATATLVACAAGASSVETSSPSSDPELGAAPTKPNLPPDTTSSSSGSGGDASTPPPTVDASPPEDSAPIEKGPLPAPQGFVQCGGVQCSLAAGDVCCIDQSFGVKVCKRISCNPTTEAAIFCDEPNDCAPTPGTKCCQELLTGGIGKPTSCRPTCLAATVCATNADCDAVNPFCCNLDGIRHCGPFKCQ